MPDQQSNSNLPQSSQSEEENNLNLEAHRKKADQWIQKFAVFAQWMLRGGSGAVWLSLLLKEDWLLALIMFPVMIVTVVFTAYTESFLMQLYEIYQKRAKEDAKSFMTFLDAANEAIKWQLSGTEDKYLRCQGNACEFDTTEGLSSTFKPLLKDIFVPLELSGDFFRGTEGNDLPMPPGFQWNKQIIAQIARQEGLQIWDLFKRAKHNPGYRYLAIQAWGGYGKTTLLRHITYRYTNKIQRRDVPKFLPILLYLRKWQEEIATGDNLDLPTLIEKYHIPSLPEGEGLKLPENWARQHLRKGKMLVMFDGFDEVREECCESVSQWIGRAMTHYSSSFFLITSRPSGYRNYTAENKPNSLFVKAFNREQRQRFIERWYLCRERHISANPKHPMVDREAIAKATNLLQQLAERSELNDLARNPLLLNLIVKLHSYAPSDPSDLSRPIQLPERRTELYRAIFQLQLGDRPLVKQINMALSARESQQILQKLALYMVLENKPQIERELLLDRLTIYLNSLDETAIPSEFLRQVEQVSELLVRRDADYEFAHLSFQACLAAMEIKESQQEGLFLQHWQESWWRETILLYTAQFNANSFLQELLNIGTQEAIDLAYNCLREAPRKIDPQLKEELENLSNKVTNSLYQPLEEYLKNEEWEKADRETSRVMLQVMGKEERGWLDEEDIEKFPCEDLRIINQLWLDYSQNRFGFSVQKEIWMSVGGIPGEYDYDIFLEYGKKVEWYVNSQWFDKITFKRDAPMGHLPTQREILFRIGFGWGYGRFVVDLFSRAETCNL